MQDLLTTIATILEGAIALLLLFGFAVHSTRPISEPEPVSSETSVEEPISIPVTAPTHEPLPIDYTGLKVQELRKLARTLGIPQSARLRKHELLARQTHQLNAA